MKPNLKKKSEFKAEFNEKKSENELGQIFHNPRHYKRNILLGRLVREHIQLSADVSSQILFANL